MNNDSKRERSAVTTAVIGLACNVALGAAKLVVGLISGSLAIAADAANNLSDVAASAVVVFSFLMSGKRPDREHPYGHGRSEYVASFAVAMLIVVVGAELVVSSVKGLINPTAPEFSFVALGVLLFSIAVKGGMAIMYGARNKKVKSDSLKAAAFDSASDCAVTAAVTLSLLLSRATSFPVDGACGAAAGLFVAFGGLKLVAGTAGRLLGGKGDEETRANLLALISSAPKVLGVHDVMIHDYGAENAVASADAEFDRRLSFDEVHETVDEIERKAYSLYGVNLVVHCDPIDVENERFNAVRRALITALEPFGRRASFHEMTIDDESKTVSVHLCLDDELTRRKETVIAALVEAVNESASGYALKAEYDFN